MTGSRRRGGGVPPSPAPAASWRERLDDPDEPLYTIAVAADLLGTDNQTLRRLGATIDQNSARPSGNQRRFSRSDLELLDRALLLAREGHGPQSVARILELEHHIAALTSSGGSGPTSITS